MDTKTKGKDILNAREFQQWVEERVLSKGLRIVAIKDFVDDIFYSNGEPLDGKVNVGWICVETQERFDYVWGYATA